MIIDEYKKEMAAAKQHLRQSMVVSLSDKPTSADAKNTEDKEKFELVCARVGLNWNSNAVAANECRWRLSV